jgi:hypothetical protein
MSNSPARGAADPFRTAADQCSAVVDRVFGSLTVLAGALADHWRGVTAESGRDRLTFTSADLAPLQPAIFETLDGQPTFDSAGYVLAEEALADRRRYLDWWHRLDGPGYHPLILDLDVASPDCYDYYQMDWFEAAVANQRRFVSGPLIDLPCAAVYVLTFSQPVVVDGQLLGIAGADVALSRFEDELIAPLLDVSAPAVLATAERRVVVSNDSRWTTGEKLKMLPTTQAEEWQSVLPVTHDLGWVLAIGERRSLDLSRPNRHGAGRPAGRISR